MYQTFLCLHLQFGPLSSFGKATYAWVNHTHYTNCAPLIHRKWYLKSKSLLEVTDHKLPVVLSHGVHRVEVDLTGHLLVDKQTGKNVISNPPLWHIQAVAQQLSDGDLITWSHLHFCLKKMCSEKKSGLQILSTLEKERIFYCSYI